MSECLSISEECSSSAGCPRRPDANESSDEMSREPAGVDDATESADILQGVAEENEDEESDEYEIEVCYSTCNACWY